jgi:hypothetical protein
VARRTASGFEVSDGTSALVAGLNTRALEYAPATSADGREIFFTRLEGSSAVILRSSREEASAPFGPPTPLAGVTGFAEAATVTCDGASVYYHRREGGEFAIYRADRAP